MTERYIPNPTEISWLQPEFPRRQKITLCTEQRGNVDFSGTCMCKRAESLSTLSLSYPLHYWRAARYHSPLQGTVLPILPVLAKSRQLHISAFSKDFTFIGLVTNSFNLEQIQVLVWLEKSQEDLISYTHIFCAFFCQFCSYSPSTTSYTQKHTRTTTC